MENKRKVLSVVAAIAVLGAAAFALGRHMEKKKTEREKKPNTKAVVFGILAAVLAFILVVTFVAAALSQALLYDETVGMDPDDAEEIVVGVWKSEGYYDYSENEEGEFVKVSPETVVLYLYNDNTGKLIATSKDKSETATIEFSWSHYDHKGGFERFEGEDKNGDYVFFGFVQDRGDDLIYFNLGEDMTVVLNRVAGAEAKK